MPLPSKTPKSSPRHPPVPCAFARIEWRLGCGGDPGAHGQADPESRGKAPSDHIRAINPLSEEPVASAAGMVCEKKLAVQPSSTLTEALPDLPAPKSGRAHIHDYSLRDRPRLTPVAV